MWSLLFCISRTSIFSASMAARTAIQRRSSSAVEIGVFRRSDGFIPACSCCCAWRWCSIVANSFGGRDVGGGPAMAALRALEPEVLAQRRAFVFGPEQAAPLQLRNHQRDEVVERAGQIGRHHVEAVAGVGAEPFLH